MYWYLLPFTNISLSAVTVYEFPKAKLVEPLYEYKLVSSIEIWVKSLIIVPSLLIGLPLSLTKYLIIVICPDCKGIGSALIGFWTFGTSL